MKLNDVVISISKHPTPGVEKWQWAVLHTHKYGLETMNSKNFDSYSLAKAGWEEFANENGITNFKYFDDDKLEVEIRTKNGITI